MAPNGPLRRRPLLVYSFAVLLPGLALAGLGLRTMEQDRRLVDQRVRDRVEGAASAAVAGLSRELARWDAAVADSVVGTDADGARLAEPIRRAVETPLAAVLIRSTSAGVEIRPPGSLLHAIPALRSQPVTAPAMPSSLAEAQALEFRERNPLRAAGAYAALTRAEDPNVRALALVGQARTLRKAGRGLQAREVYATLEKLPSAVIGTLPADMIGLDGRCDMLAETGAIDDLASCGLAFYRGLVDGRWLLERPRYAFYSERVKQWLRVAHASSPELGQLAAAEGRKAALTAFAAGLIEQLRAATTGARGHRLLWSGDGPALAFWATDPAGATATALVLATDFVAGEVWPRAVSAAIDSGVRVSILAPDGSLVFASAPDSDTPGVEPAVAASRDLQDGGFLWRVRATPRDIQADYAGLRSRQLLYGAMLALMVSSLVAGVVLTWRTLQRELEVAARESAFVSAVSHEFRSPLAGIRQLSDMLVRGRVPSDDRRQQYYLTIRRESDRLARLVDNVLDIARIKDGRKDYRVEPIDTVAWLRGVTDEFQQTLDTEHRHVVAAIPDTLPAIRGDRQALSTVVHNLLDNAVKYSPGCPTVWLDADVARDSISIHVRDEGVGIPPDEQARVFDRFYRGRELADEVRGTGLGLSLVRHIVEVHGGSIDLASAPGTGSTFTVRLPRASGGSAVQVTSAKVVREADTT